MRERNERRGLGAERARQIASEEGEHLRSDRGESPSCKRDSLPSKRSENPGVAGKDLSNALKGTMLVRRRTAEHFRRA